VERYVEGRAGAAVETQAGRREDGQRLVEQPQGQHPPAALWRHRQRAGEIHHLADRGRQRGGRVIRDCA